MPVTTIYRTEDGEVWDSLEEAERHQKTVDVWEGVKEKFGTYGEVRLNYLSDFLDIIKFYEENK